MFYRIVFLILSGSILLSCESSPTREESEQREGIALPDTVTFAEHIAPIVWQNCMPCHRPGSAGPFSLISYRDVAKRAKMVAHVTSTRYMPPWPADPEYRHFAGERVLTQHEIDLISKWASQKAPAGNLERLKDPPAYPDGSMMGEPDLVVEMKEAYPIQGNNTDRFLFMKLPFQIPADTFVRAIEFVPGNRKAVHHMNGHLISFDPAKKADVFEGDWVVDREQVPVNIAYPQMGLLQDDGSYPQLTPLVCNYLPGVTPNTYPHGIGGYRITQKGAFLLNDLHYGPLGADTSDQSRFNVFFASEPPKRPTLELQLGTLGISDIVPPLVIPPDTVMTFTTRAVIRQDVSLLTINPHMHLLGKSFEAYAIAPSGDTIPLIRIPEWDFRWQYFYTFDHLLKLPAGSIVEVIAEYDNTIENPNNPFDPPRMIAERDGSMKTTDEMLQCILTFVPYEEGDEQVELSE